MVIHMLLFPILFGQLQVRSIKLIYIKSGVQQISNINYYIKLYMLRSNYKKVELPQEYAWDLLNNQIQFELGQNVNINLVNKLIQLYALGVQYYESLRSYKYLYFQKKMNNLMKSPLAMKSMDEQVQSPDRKSIKVKKQQSNQKNEDDIKMMLTKQKQNQMQKIILYETAEISTSKVKEIIQTSEKQVQQYNQKIKDEITQQNDKIQQKISRRRNFSKNSLYKSFSQMSSSDFTSCQNLFIQSPLKKITSPDRVQKIVVDFSGLINQNQDDDDIKYVKKL